MSNDLTVKQSTGLIERMAQAAGLDKQIYFNTIKATCFTGNATNEQFAAFLLVAEKYGLNPLTKEIWAFPSKGGICPMVSYQGWCNIVTNNVDFDGVEIETNFEEGKPFSSTCKIYRKSLSRPIIKTVYLKEWIKETSPVWKTQPTHFLEIRAYIQCARIAFGLSGIFDEDVPMIDIANNVTQIKDESVNNLNAQIKEKKSKTIAPEIVDVVISENDFEIDPAAIAQAETMA